MFIENYQGQNKFLKHIIKRKRFSNKNKLKIYKNHVKQKKNTSC